MVNRDDLIAYLLHQMPEEDRAAFAEKWFAEPELYERLQMVEAELLDDYVRGKLSPEQRRDVEQHLLGSETQRRKLAFAETLQAALPRRRRFPVLWAALVAAMILIVAGVAIWLGIQDRTLQQELVRAKREIQPLTASIYTFSLPADTLRGSAVNAISIPEGARLLRLELELRPGDEKGVYSAALLSGDRVLWNEGPVRPEPQGRAFIAPVWVPAEVLGAGVYAVQLDISGNPVAYYNFKVTR